MALSAARTSRHTVAQHETGAIVRPPVNPDAQTGPGVAGGFHCLFFDGVPSDGQKRPNRTMRRVRWRRSVEVGC